VLSLILWSLTITVTIKYVLILLRADNNGEGGTLSLTALAARVLGRRTTVLFTLGMIGAAMFYGDSVITPAMSVLSAIEGLKLASPAFEHAVLPLTVLILVALFAVQSRGHRSGRGFLWSGDGLVVPDNCRRRNPAFVRRSTPVCRGQSTLCDFVPLASWRDRPGDARVCVPGSYWRGSTLC